MHAVPYVCLPRPQARSSLQAQKRICEYLTEECLEPIPKPLPRGRS